MPRIDLDLEKRICAALNERKQTGEGVRKIAKRFRVNPSTVQRISRPFDGAAARSRRLINESKATLAGAIHDAKLR
jgi:hypothetical protein